MDQNYTFNRYLASVYSKTALGLIISALTGIILLSKGVQTFTMTILSNPWLILLLFVVELFIIFRLHINAARQSTTTPLWYIGFAISNGLTFASVFAYYDPKTIILAFGALGLTFLAMSMLGFIIKKDLGNVARVLWFMTLGLIIASIINLFVMNSVLYMILTFVGLVIFSIYIVVDTKQMRDNYNYYDAHTLKYGTSWIDSTNLYLDLLNLFLYILDAISIFSNDD